MSEGVDYAWARPGGAALAAAGKTFAARYLFPGTGKGLKADEVADLHAHGIAIAVAFEGGGQGTLNGYTQGANDAAVAQQELNQSGLDAGLPIYFAVDFEPSSAQFATIDAYLAGAGSVIGAGRVGVYGGLNMIRHAQAAGSAHWFWQTYGWSYGQVADGIHLYQHLNGQTINGGSVDFTRSMQNNFGQLAAGTAGSSSTPITEEDDMYSDADRQRDTASASRTEQIEAALLGTINGAPVALNPLVNFGQSIIYGLDQARKAVQAIKDKLGA
jgi:hypothetical protein